MIRIFPLLKALIFIIFSNYLLPSKVFSEESSPEMTVRNLLDTIQMIKTNTDFSSKQERVNRRLSSLAITFLDIEEISRKTLGKYWKKQSLNEQKKFVILLSKLFEKIAFPKSSQFFSELEIVYQSISLREGVATLPMLVTHKDEGEVEIDFVMHKSEEKWKVIEVILDGLSMRNNLRFKFQQIISQDNFANLILRMNKKLKGQKN